MSVVDPLWKVVKLENLHLIKSTAFTNYFPEELPPEPPGLRLFISCSYKILPKTRKIEIMVTFKLQAVDAEEAEKIYFQIDSKYRVAYGYPDDYVVQKDDVRDFADRNAPFNVYPYFRELVHSELGRMGINMEPIPLFRVPPKLEISDNKKAKQLIDKEKVSKKKTSIKKKN